MAENVLEVTDETFDEQVKNADVPVMLDIWAPWCGPCRMVSPIVEELAEEYEGSAKVAKLNVDENSETASKFGISSIPAVLFFKGGTEVSERRIVGARSKAEYKEVLEDLIED
jgi:thioredoxin 1